MKITISSKLEISNAPQTFAQNLREIFTVLNPRWIENEKMSRWNGATVKWLKFYESRPTGLIIPRGGIGLILDLARQWGIPISIIDHRRTLRPVEFAFTGTLKGYQEKALQDILRREMGVLEASTGSGKTITALMAIAARKQPTLIIVHNKELLNQWLDRIETFLGIPRAEIGVIGGGKKRIGERITVGIINSVYPIAAEIRERFGHLVIDECHRCPSRTFTEAVTAFDCRYMLGLSATPYRRDGLTKLIEWHLGRKIVVRASGMTSADIVLNVDVVTRETAFNSDLDASQEYSRMLSDLTADHGRNALIAADVAREATNGGGICLVLSDRKEHCGALSDILRGRGIPSDVLTGGVCDTERKAIVERLQAGETKVLIATGQLIGEGFDCRELQTLFLATPIKFEGRLIQYLGRILRPAPGKDRATVYDYVDTNVGVLVASARARARVYATRSHDEGGL